jgi:osmoprotectant transport system substrate-binding protein
VAIVLGVASAAMARPAHPGSKSADTIILGTKNFPEEFILGQLYKQALEAKGFTVSYKENIGSTELIQTSLTSGKINMYPEYTGVIVQVVFHRALSAKTAQATYQLAKKLEAGKGFTLLAPTPFYDTDAIAGLHNNYKLTNVTFVPLANISPYAALDAGKVQAAAVFSTDPVLGKGSKYVLLSDPVHQFGFQNVAPIVKTSLVQSLGAKFTQTINAVSKKLTQAAIVAMNKAVIIDGQKPADVAAKFLQANGLA